MKEQKRHNRTIDSRKEDKSLTWSMTVSRSVGQSTLFLTWTSLWESSWRMTTYKASTPHGTKYFSQWQKFQRKIYLEICTKPDPVLRGSETPIRRIRCRKEERPEMLDWNKWFAVMWSRKKRTGISVPVTKTGLFKEQQPGKGTQKEILKAVEMLQAKTGNMEVGLGGPHKISAREEIRAASSTICTKGEGGRKNIQFPFQCDEKELERWRKRRYQRVRTQRYQSVCEVKQAGGIPFWRRGKKESACD